MIFYFSGTGNSKLVAETLGKALEQTPISLNDFIRRSGAQNGGCYVSETPFVFVTPTYAWRLPRVVEKWMGENDFSGNRDAYFVMTCGSETGNAGQYAKALCAQKGLHFRGVYSIVMPENYIAMFRAPTLPQAKNIIDKAIPDIEKAAACILANKDFPTQKIRSVDKLYSGVVNKAFYKLFVSAKGFTVTSACVGCGVCVQNCPLQNIKLQNGKPVWGDCCTHCMACICRCPKEAIEYKKKSRGQTRYTAEQALNK